MLMDTGQEARGWCMPRVFGHLLHEPFFQRSYGRATCWLVARARSGQARPCIPSSDLAAPSSAILGTRASLNCRAGAPHGRASKASTLAKQLRRRAAKLRNRSMRSRSALLLGCLYSRCTRLASSGQLPPRCQRAKSHRPGSVGEKRQ